MHTLSTEKCEQLIDGLRGFADFIEQKLANGEEVPYFYHSVGFTTYLTQTDYVKVEGSDDEWESKFNEADTKKALAHFLSIVGSCDKEFQGDHVRITKKFGDFVKFEAVVNREVTCKKVPTGEVKHHEAYTVEARDEVVYEWECSDESMSLIKLVKAEG